MQPEQPDNDRIRPLPFVVPCAVLTWRAPLRWLRRGWSDLCRAPGLSAVFGLMVVLASLALAALAWRFGSYALLALLVSGSIFVAPLLGTGLYGISRALEYGVRPSFGGSLRLARYVLGQAAVFALMQMVILMVWARAGMMLYAFVPVEDGRIEILLGFLVLGSGIGSVFAAITFAVAAFSLPMIADRDVDMVTACISSVNAVLRNKGVCLLWAVLIVTLTAIGFATLFLGLGLIIPLLAYATWHGYRETMDASAWPLLDAR